MSPEKDKHREYIVQEIKQSEDYSENEENNDMDQEKILKDGDGNNMIEKDEKLRITIKNWKGKTFIDIRNHYKNNNGIVMPTPKGIFLSIENWEWIKNNISVIDEMLEDKK
eukprot:GHVP01031459.1.p1 GENE.GHVP01031459.1~~GHVP01031459.1.p1  ORF type:complete len:111 (-),score=31.40 GHVP01031459.1:903-1235(-)